MVENRSQKSQSRRSRRWIRSMGWLGLAGLCCFSWLGSAGCQSGGLQFPEGFYFGTSIAGFQGDMGCPTLAPEKCEDRNSDWYQWTTSSEIQSKGGQDANGKEFAFASKDPISWGPGQWELYESDYDLMQKQLGIKAYRLSIEWSRIFPKSTIGVEGYEALKAIADKDAIARYHQMFQALRKRGIEPFVTLNHYTLPLWIHDGVSCFQDFQKCTKKGWADPKTLLPEIAKYAGFVAKEFGAEVDAWITLNEPFAVILPGYLLQTADRVNPPGVSLQFAAARTVIIAMIEAHAKMYDAIKAADTVDASGDGKNSWIGIAYSFAPVYPKDPKRERDVQAAKNTSYLLNEVFFEALIHGKLDEKLDRKTVSRPDLQRMDWIGVNYYMRVTVTGFGSPPLPELSPVFTADPFNLNYEPQFPKGMYDLLELVKTYKKPIVITENGHDMPTTGTDKAADDSEMPAYIVRHLFWLHKAIQDGADVRGYLYWSFVDNFEWNHGFNLRFGLFGVDGKDKTKARKARSGVATFQQIISQGGLSKEQLAKYLTADEQALLEK